MLSIRTIIISRHGNALASALFAASSRVYEAAFSVAYLDGLTTKIGPGKLVLWRRGWGVFAMIRGVFAISIAAALGLATLPGEVSAKGFGLHASHKFGSSVRHHHHRAFGFRHHHRAFGYIPYGGFVDAGPAIGVEPDSGAPLLQVGGVTTPPRCIHSQEIVTVPSEKGGTQQITITRC
jgi:hypothetical protein